MIGVTDRAKDELKQLILTRLAASGCCLRLVPANAAHFGLVPDAPRADDQRLEHDGTVVLLLQRSLAALLDGWTIDCVEADDGMVVRLRLRPGRSGLGSKRGTRWPAVPVDQSSSGERGRSTPPVTPAGRAAPNGSQPDGPRRNRRCSTDTAA
jgi:hypothetical protein